MLGEYLGGYAGGWLGEPGAALVVGSSDGILAEYLGRYEGAWLGSTEGELTRPKHVRTKIRQAVVALLTDLPTTGANVFDGRVHTIQEDELPALLVYAGNDELEYGTSGNIQSRVLELTVEAVFKDSASLDDVGDQVLASVEDALSVIEPNLGGAKYARLIGVEIDRDGDGEQPAARMTMSFQFPYYTTIGDPTVAL